MRGTTTQFHLGKLGNGCAAGKMGVLQEKTLKWQLNSALGPLLSGLVEVPAVGFPSNGISYRPKSVT